jgi:ABC-type tungstate transport system permease subunit
MATKANISIDQGTSFSTTIILTDENGGLLDLSAYTANAQIRRWYTSSNSVTFDTSLAEGQVTLSLNSSSTALLSRDRYVYDVILTDDNDVITRVVEGIVTVNPRVTR